MIQLSPKNDCLHSFIFHLGFGLCAEMFDLHIVGEGASVLACAATQVCAAVQPTSPEPAGRQSAI